MWSFISQPSSKVTVIIVAVVGKYLVLAIAAAAVAVHRQSKNMPLSFCHNFATQTLAFQNSFTGTLYKKFPTQ